MVVTVKYIDDEKEYEFDLIKSITNNENIIYINCSDNQLTLLPDNMNFPLIREFDFSNNQITSLPDNLSMIFPNLLKFYCCYNRLTSLPENMSFPNLQVFNCSNNQLTLLPDNMNFPLIREFDCSNNQITSLPDNLSMIFPNLQEFYCYGNRLTSLPKHMNFPNLLKFYCCYNRLTSLPENMSFPNLQVFNCSDNEVTSLPNNMNFPSLEEFYFSSNQLTLLPENMNFPNLQKFYCRYNKLTSLPENMNFPNLQEFSCSWNQLTSLPENMNFPNLQIFYCGCNKLTSLPENMNFPNLQEFYCNDNKLTSLPENMNFPLLRVFYSDYNQLTSLPVCIMDWRNLRDINYAGNEIELSPQLARFINRINSGSVSKINVYGDAQNVHNTSIQCSVKNSINRLTTKINLLKFDAEILNAMILTDEIITPSVKAQLIEYCHDGSVHSLLLLTFAEVLWYVLNTIIHDFKDSTETQTEIKRVLNQEMQDAECKCFTGRMNRVVNCLNGFSPLVDIRISDGEQIGNVIVMLKDKALDSEGTYSVSRHKQLVEHELRERGYDSETVTQWLEYIE